MMQSALLKSKLHNATITAVERDYVGSLGIDSDLMEAVGILPYEKILVANIDNGERLETYAIPEPAGSGAIILNGAAAHKGAVGQRLIVLTFGLYDQAELATYAPRTAILKAGNRL